MKTNDVIVIGLGGWSTFMVVDHFHANGETLNANAIDQEPGGKGYNQAVTIATLGGKCSFVGAFGNDIYGTKCLEYLASVDVQANCIIKEGPTAQAYILTNKKGDNQVTVFSGVSTQITSYDIAKLEEQIASSEILLLQQEVDYQVNKRAIEIALKYQTRVILNPAPVSDYTSLIYNKEILLTPNEFEARHLFNIDGTVKQGELGKKLLEQGVDNCVVTLGNAGALIINNNQYHYLVAPSVDAIDTTGAGDVFNGIIALELAHKKTLIEAVQKAVTMASTSVRYQGVLNSIKRLKV